jgi:two-component system, cell cycle response regulator DivK
MPTILYVEDNPENRMLVRRVLTAGGFEILEAANADETMNVVENCTLDLILMDINLPEVDGYTLTSRLKQMPRLNRTPIVALTANVMRGDRERALSAGCDGYIQKPVDVDLLPDQVGRYIQEASHG